ncbi:RNI-like protein [Wolfiporia cocos MD-104 SS10]|uniref:RNI-like protein n=1 Tax=Wolfiporia cocos (strain MD-104) TaxID=742152 RepID=A0A2H3JH56_WOLCO|nr:RNI-like protein [Wolfiporia cocos MD-104 SS10]
MHRSRSPAQSSTSASDNEDEDINKSSYFPNPESISPAQWSSPHVLRPHAPDTLPYSPASFLPPEILIHILKHLHSSRDLYNAMLVSRAWCECSVELLWYRPSFSGLATLVKMMRVLSRHDQTFQYALFIRRLNFLYLGGELSDSLLSRLAYCTRLERLTLINCSTISDEGLSRVLPRCPNLVALDLTGVTEVSDKSIIALASSTKGLQGINLGNCKKLTDQAILALAANCPLLRRIKLSNVEQITDAPVVALAHSCPLLLEIDLNNCGLITDTSVRELWKHLTQMREMRLSHCSELTDAAFPAPPRPELAVAIGINPFPTFAPAAQDKLPPLRITRTFEHLRMLDLTACAHITDDAIEGIISVAPRIRNLVLAKCTQLTDVAVESICTLGKHLHYLHLGHASRITDRSIRSLARSCTRLRYIDLANCVQLTDMSVFELSALQKLRRIGLVRVNHLTDQAIYALGDRHSTLERIHLSYCEQITVMSIHFLLQKLPKLTHLSLTGVPAFRRDELQQFCRTPPEDFNSTQRASFCVYSGRGVSQLRNYLMNLYTHMTEDINEDEDTDYDDVIYADGAPLRDMRRSDLVDDRTVDGNEGDDDTVDAHIHHPNIVVSRGGYRTNGIPEYVAPHEHIQRLMPVTRDLAMSRDRGHQPVPRSVTAPQPFWLMQQPVAQRRGRGFGQQPIVEPPSSPVPSEVASNGSEGTSRGTTFFRTYTDASATAGPSRNGVITPDLVYAEIGHGRGTGILPNPVYVHDQVRRPAESVITAQTNGSHPHHPVYTHPHAGSSTQSQSTITNGSRLPVVDTDSDYPIDMRSVLVDSSNSYQQSSGRTVQNRRWSAGHREVRSRSLSASPTTRELQESIHTALGPQSGFFDNREGDGRGRSVKRTIRNTFSAAEQFANAFFGGRGHGGSGHEGAAGPANGRDSDAHGY